MIYCSLFLISPTLHRKDIVLRVIAAGLNPENCTVVRVMTPNPDSASPETTVLDALKLMNGMFLFLIPSLIPLY
jgi:signal-transduction protein with cAMP-binding, CBS, and nucleotidyltransferase domain